MTSPFNLLVTAINMQWLQKMAVHVKLHDLTNTLHVVYRVGVWFGFVMSALHLAVVTCTVLSFEAMPDLCCFLRVTLHVVPR